MKILPVVIAISLFPIITMAQISGGVPTGPVSNSTVIATGSTTPLTLADRAAASKKIKDFGAKCDGSTNDATAISAAISAAIATGGTVIFPGGTCKVTSKITIGAAGVYIVGSGPGQTTVLTTVGGDDTFYFNGSGGAIMGGGITNLSIVYSGSTPTAGAGIEIGNAGEITIEHALVHGTYNGITVNQNTQGAARILSVDAQSVVNDSFLILATNGTWIDNCTTFQAGSPGGAGYHIKNAGGVRLTNSTSSLQATGLLIDPGTGQDVVDIWLSNLDLDASTANGLVIDTSAGTGTARNIFASNVRTGFANDGSFTSGGGVSINGTGSKAITFTGGESVSNTTTGVNILGGSKITFDGFNVLGNSKAGSGSYVGVAIQGGDGVIFNNAVAGQYTDGSTNNQSFGVALYSTFTGAVTVKNNDLRGNATAAFINSTTSGSINVAGNQGYVTASSGSAVIANGTNVITFNHGLAAAPTSVVIAGNNIAYTYATISNSTQITIAASANVVGAVTVWWKAELGPQW